MSGSRRLRGPWWFCRRPSSELQDRGRSTTLVLVLLTALSGACGNDAGGAGNSGGAANTGGGAGMGSGGADPVNIFVDRVPDPTQCLPRALVPGQPGSEDAGRVSCRVFELWFAAGACACNQHRGRQAVTADLEAAAESAAARQDLCDTEASPNCESACVCEIRQTEGADLATCQSDVEVSEAVYGFCYVDPAAGFGTPELVEDCPVNDRRRLRFLGADTPAADADVFIGCTG